MLPLISLLFFLATFVGASQLLGSFVMLASRLCCTVRAERAFNGNKYIHILCIAHPYKTEIPKNRSVLSVLLGSMILPVRNLNLSQWG